MFWNKRANETTSELVMRSVERQLANWLDDYEESLSNDDVLGFVRLLNLSGTHAYLAGFIGKNSRRDRG